MVWGAKFWHGNMTASLVFPLSNPYTQNRGASQGICTAASLAWCRAVLRKGRVNSFAEIGVSEHNLNIQMHTIRTLDHDPQAQTSLAQLEIVGTDHDVDLNGMLDVVKATDPHVAIFWTAEHTMGYRYSHHEKEFFDMEEGLFRAKYTDGIRAKIRENYDGEVIGCRVVRLPW